jgi:hypothetical protein
LKISQARWWKRLEAEPGTGTGPQAELRTDFRGEDAQDNRAGEVLTFRGLVKRLGTVRIHGVFRLSAPGFSRKRRQRVGSDDHLEVGAVGITTGLPFPL